MIQRIKKHLVVIVATLAILIPGLMPSLLTSGMVYAVAGTGASNAGSTVSNGLCSGLDAGLDSGASTGCTTSATTAGSTIAGIARTVINIFSMIVGIAAVVMIIYGGFRYVTSGGASDKVGNAKNTLVYAIVGLIIVALAQAIVHFVLSQSNNVSAS